ncbi:MAG: hypothetical protein JWQ20_3710 [Conexibacter sp.]|nr:hypothetical protein [Conexibacter sp.]
MTDFMDGLEQDLFAAAQRLHAPAPAAERDAVQRLRRGRGRRWLPRGPLMLAGGLALATGVATAGGTLLVLRGSDIGPSAAVAPEQTPKADSSRVLAVRVADPAPGQPPWTLRLATGRTGLACLTVGQVAGGRFGLVGLDGRFRSIAPQVADACSSPRPNASTSVGVRTFEGRAGRLGVRSVISGVGGPQLRRVTLSAGGRARSVPVGQGGTFLAVFAGVPEDLQLKVQLRFADGHRELHPFGVSPGVFADPDGGHAWRLEGGSQSGDARVCIQVRPARDRTNPSISRSACGVTGPDPAHPQGVFFDTVRMTPSEKKPADVFGQGFWHQHPPRTIVLGFASQDVKSVSITGPPGATHAGTRIPRGGQFAEMFGPEVLPAQVTVRVRYRDGHTATFRGSHRLMRKPVPAPMPGKTP